MPCHNYGRACQIIKSYLDKNDKQTNEKFESPIKSITLLANDSDGPNIIPELFIDKEENQTQQSKHHHVNRR